MEEISGKQFVLGTRFLSEMGYNCCDDSDK